MDYSLNQRNFCRSSFTTTRGDEEGLSLKSVELLNYDKKLKQKVKIMIPEEKSSTEKLLNHL